MSRPEIPTLHDEIRFSHVEAHFVGAIACPDCGLVMWIHEDLLHCSCGETFKVPTITLERTPSEDYTRPDPPG